MNNSRSRVRVVAGGHDGGLTASIARHARDRIDMSMEWGASAFSFLFPISMKQDFPHYCGLTQVNDQNAVTDRAGWICR
jgi:hypothetical protein